MRYDNFGDNDKALQPIRWVVHSIGNRTKSSFSLSVDINVMLEMLFIRSFIWPKRTLNLSERGLCGLQHKKESKKQRKTLHSHHHELRILRTIVLAFVNCGGRAHSLHLFRPHFYTQFSISHAPHLPAVRWAKSSLFSSVFMKNEKQH